MSRCSPGAGGGRGKQDSVTSEEAPLFELKPLRAEAIPAALAKAERYRLLNEPEQAESICQDVLRTQPGNQQAITLYLLAITDSFRTSRPPDVWRARALLEQFDVRVRPLLLRRHRRRAPRPGQARIRRRARAPGGATTASAAPCAGTPRPRR